MKFSVCIPNYNYQKYLVKTIQSVLNNPGELEILVSDNCSKDGSVSCVQEFTDPRIKLSVNRWNLGFAGNLDRACRMASGSRMVLLSSDDIAYPTALETYNRLAESIGGDSDESIFSSDQYIINENDEVQDQWSFDRLLWKDAWINETISERMGCEVWQIDAKTLLARSLGYLRTPFWFATTCYSRKLYDRVEGYGGGYLYNPDKVFAWKILSVAEYAYHVKKPLFGYRVHNDNQSAIQLRTKTLKHLVDQYKISFETDDHILAVASTSRDELAKAFVEQDIALRALNLISHGQRALATRYLHFGYAAYPCLMKRSPKIFAARIALLLGPLGTWLASRLRARATAKFKSNN